ncbi:MULTISPECIES: hypothetical protein [Microbispora]|uniref:NIF system FeS cluster assembly NifU C-terminal domain-containing protein n=1 Tax=Microbispora hainanensis TaxID=568844 RepID=A0A544YP26_9ACTN|nr:MULTISPECIES: hypothetical protein [Microbispora]TQS18538.1 hypothetical protein FLX08_23630 [Microbispora hainanensis]
MTIARTELRPIPRRQDGGRDRDEATGPLARRAVRETLREVFTDVVDDVRLVEIDGMVHVYVFIRPIASACPEHIRATAREAYRAVHCEPVVAHVAASCSAHGR